MAKHDHITLDDPCTSRSVSFGLTDDRERVFVGYRTHERKWGVVYVDRERTASLGGKLLGWAQQMPEGPVPGDEGNDP